MVCAKFNEILELCKCGKKAYSNGQKKRLSGYMGNWTTLPYKFYRSKVVGQTKKGNDKVEWKPEESVHYVFCYKQKIQVDKQFFKDNWKIRNQIPEKDRRAYLLREGKWWYPHFSYGCAFMVGHIVEIQGDMNRRFSWYSGDDDIGNDFTFPVEDIEKVKKFILLNHQDEDFSWELGKFIEENQYHRW